MVKNTEKGIISQRLGPQETKIGRKNSSFYQKYPKMVEYMSN